MSLDAQLAWPCPHLTVEEVVPLGSDRMSLDTRQPVAASGLVRILVNDEVFVPQGGFFSAAQISGVTSGPFDILANENVLTIESSGGTESVTFPVTGSVVRMTTDQVVKRCAAAGLQSVLVENVGGFLTLTDRQKVGPGSYLRVRGTAATALGFGAPGTQWAGRPWGVQGRQVYPGWNLYLRPDEITNRFPKFTSPVRGNPVFKVTYAVPVTRCLRCRATYVENDFRFNPAGEIILVQNEDLLYQAALKILLTDLGSNPFHSWYGTTIRSRIGTKALSGTSAVLSEDVRRALTRMQTLQAQQAKYQQVTFKERLYTILGVDVQRHRQDPTTFLIDVTVQNASGEPVLLNIVFTVPEVVALMGSNGLMLGTEAAGLGVDEARTMFPADRNRLTGGQ